MRDIKFRAWDGEKMRYPNLINTSFTVGPLTCYTTDNLEPGFFDTEQLMQFTGLTDKNGVEIYEGDVLRYRYPRDMSGKDIVEFDEVVEWENTTDFMGFGIHQLMEHEIIGNTYQHPELLRRLRLCAGRSDVRICTQLNSICSLDLFVRRGLHKTVCYMLFFLCCGASRQIIKLFKL